MPRDGKPDKADRGEDGAEKKDSGGLESNHGRNNDREEDKEEMTKEETKNRMKFTAGVSKWLHENIVKDTDIDNLRIYISNDGYVSVDVNIANDNKSYEFNLHTSGRNIFAVREPVNDVTTIQPDYIEEDLPF
jgi:hypothetical protein